MHPECTDKAFGAQQSISVQTAYEPRFLFLISKKGDFFMEKTAKNRAKLLKLIATIMLVATMVTALVALTACNANDTKQPESKDLASVEFVFSSDGVNFSSVDFDTDATTVFDALVDAKEQGVISVFEYVDETSPYVVEIEDLTSGDNSFISILHTLDDIAHKDMSEWSQEVEYDAKTFTSSSSGIKLLPVEDGASYMFLLATF